MSWLGIRRLEGDIKVYDVEPQEVKRTDIGLTFNGRTWLAGSSKSRLGDNVRVYVPLGALSGLHKHVIVQLQDGTIEQWPRKDVAFTIT